MTVLAPAAWWRGLGALTRSGSSVEGLAWALYDFANTIFSFAIVSFAMGPWATRFLGEGPGTFFFTLVVAILASFGWGALADRWGPKRTLLVVLASWGVGLLIIGLVLERTTFLIAGAILGSGLGGVAVTDRLLLIRLAPRERIGEMFGLFGLVGKLSTVIGPVLYGVIILVLEPSLDRVAYQIAILSLLGLMLVGIWIFRRVPEPPPAGEAEGSPPATPLEPAIVAPGELPR